MDLHTRNLTFHLEQARKNVAQKIIDEPSFADSYQVGKTIDDLGKSLYELRTGKLTCEEFMDRIPSAPDEV